MAVPTFAMHDLGWSAFQQLSHTILREILGQSVQSFLDSKDGGRDGAFRGRWKPVTGLSYSGAFVLQCKHTARPSANLSLNGLKDELAKAKRLVDTGDCDVYLLMTNAGVSGAEEEKIRRAFLAEGVKHVLVFGSNWMNQTIAESPRLRRLVPRLYGLGDLTQILDARAYSQARAVLDSMRSDLNKLVLTSTYTRATTALEEHGFVLLFGSAATGKTTIAAQLALGSADEFDTAVVKLDNAADFQARWNPEERQLFWLDDAFGATQLDVLAARAWTAALPRISSAIQSGSKVVLTSRDYIFNAARKHLKPGSFPLFEEARVVVNVRDIDLTERRQILYNHLRHGTQPNSWVEALGPHLEAAAAHPAFTPELARRLSHPYFTPNVRPYARESVEQFFSEPDSFLRDVIDGLDSDARAALGLIFVHHDWLPSPLELDDRSTDLVGRLGSSLGGLIAALDALNGSLVRHLAQDGATGWVFAHPTMADAFSSQMRSPDLIGHLLDGFPLSTLMREVTCGDVGIDHALIVGPAHFRSVLARLDEPITGSNYEDSWREKARRVTFLATRCDRAFLELWYEENVDTVSSFAYPGLMLEAVAENELVVRLKYCGVLPEDVRSQFAEGLIEYCVTGADPAVLWNEGLRSVLTADEWGGLLLRVRNELLNDLRSALSTCVEDVDLSSTEAYSAVEPLSTLAMHLPDLFPRDPFVERRARELDRILDDWVSEQPEYPRRDRYSSRAKAAPPLRDAVAPAEARSMFDDLLDGRSGS